MLIAYNMQAKTVWILYFEPEFISEDFILSHDGLNNTKHLNAPKNEDWICAFYTLKYSVFF